MPLLSAAKVGDVVNIRRLVAEGADVNLPGAGGVRPLPGRHRRDMWMRCECW